MNLEPWMGSPNVYTIPATRCFVDELARNIIELYASDDPSKLADVTILLPSRRACRSLQSSFLKFDKEALLLPKMQPIGEVEDNGDIEFGQFAADQLQSAKPISLIRQRLILTKLIEKWQEQNNLSSAYSAHLAVELSAFLSEVQSENLQLEDLDNIVPQELARHWQVTLDFLKILARQWPLILQEYELADRVDYQSNMMKMQGEYWQSHLPTSPIIAAGSTGSMPMTAQFLKTIACLPSGMVILPGLDQYMSEEVWDNVSYSHPQYSMKKLLKSFGIGRDEVKIFGDSDMSALERQKSEFLSHLMCPYQNSGSWQQLEFANIKDIVSNVQRIDAEHLQQEAQIISLILRQVLHEDKKTAALITNERKLARNVSSVMKKWGVTIDDSVGMPLAQTSEAILFRQVASAVINNFAPIDLLACLKHPFVSAGITKQQLKANVRRLEMSYLRGIRSYNSLIQLIDSISAKDYDLKEWLQSVETIFRPMALLCKAQRVDIVELLRAHVQCLENLVSSDNKQGSEVFWSNAAGQKLQDLLSELNAAAQDFGEIQVKNYSSIIDASMEGQMCRAQYGNHPRVAILSPIEARMHNYDLIIIGGMNEDSWPRSVGADPWMSRPMRSSFGLPFRERKLGLAAHDFVQFLSTKQVIITRSKKLDGSQTIASRWLLRLEVLLKNLSKDSLLASDLPWQSWLELLADAGPVSLAQRPMPMPPKQARVKRLSVTGIEKLMRDPYVIYASKILRLNMLKPLDQDPGAAEFGNFIHEVAEIFTKKYQELGDLDRRSYLMNLGSDLLRRNKISPVIAALWQPRFERIVDWMLENEPMRRELAEKILVEQDGSVEIALTSSEDDKFVIHAKADRIELSSHGEIAVIDYKTGTLPTKGNMHKGLAAQMVLETIIANEAGFGIKGKVHKIIYWQVTGGAVPVKELVIEGDELTELLDAATEGIEKLLNLFNNEETPYLACPNPINKLTYNDYEHLSRIKEWLE